MGATTAALRDTLERWMPRRTEQATYIWYGIELAAADGAVLPSTPSRLRRATGDDQELIAQIPRDPSVTTITPRVVSQRTAQGATLWLVDEAGRLAFSCWTFEGSGPVDGAPGGQLALPPGVIYLEDSITVPNFRGRGIAPATWEAIRHQVDGRLMITKVDVTNTSSRRAVEKAGFRDLASMTVTWSGWRTQARVEVPAESPLRWLGGLNR